MVDSPTAIRPVRNESTAKHNDNKLHESPNTSRHINDNDNYRDRERRRDDWGRHRDDHGRRGQSDRPRMSDHHANEYDIRNDRRYDDREHRRDHSHFNDQRRYSEDHHRGRGRHVEDQYRHHSRTSRSSSHHPHDRRRHENENFHRNRSRSRSRSRSRDRRQHYNHNSRDYHRHDRDSSSSHRDRRNNSNRSTPSHSPTPVPPSGAQSLPADPQLGSVQDDPRGSTRMTRKVSTRGNGRNTESFDPKSTLVRPHLRIQIASGASSSKEDSKYEKKLKHDDVVIVPELFGKEDDWGNYYQLVEEMREIQRQEKEGKGGEKADNTTHEEEKKEEETTPTLPQQQTSSSSSSKQRQNKNKAEWISWHEGAHLISKNPDHSPLFQSIVKRLCHYFSIDTNKPIGTRFNWYRDSSDWKPLHHDSAAFNPARARNQNITIGVSFGATRELAFIRAVDGDGNNYGGGGGGGNDEKCRLYFPQMNNGVFTFGRDANILWKHGINALPKGEQDGKGRISIILWGFAKEVVEEEGSPPLLGSNGQGPHAARRGERGGGGGGRRNHDHGQSRDYGGSRDFQEGRGRDNRGNHPSR